MKITAWRIVQARHVRTAFTGAGARLFSGRWNQRGTPMVYTAGSLSLAAMEMLVHLDAPEILKLYMTVQMRFDSSLCRWLSPDDLPSDWADNPPPQSTRRIGTAWVHRADSAVLAVPSAVVHVDTVFLLNPGHPDSSKIQVGKAVDFSFAPRLLKKIKGTTSKKEATR